MTTNSPAADQDTTVDLLNRATELAPVPDSLATAATPAAWIRHYTAQAVAANAAFRAALRTLPPNPERGSRPDLGLLAALTNASIAAAAALTADSPRHAADLIWCLTPEAGALNGEWEDWANETLAGHGINPADIDPDLDPAGFTPAPAVAANPTA